MKSLSEDDKQKVRLEELKTMFLLVDDGDGKGWLYITQSGITYYRSRYNREFPFLRLAEVADELSEVYHLPREKFYDRTTYRFGNYTAKAVRVPVGELALKDYGK